MSRQLRQSEVKARRDQYDAEPSKAGSCWAEIHNRFLCSDIARRQDLDAAIAREDNAGDRERRRKIQERATRVRLRRAADELLERSATATTPK